MRIRRSADAGTLVPGNPLDRRVRASAAARRTPSARPRGRRTNIRRSARARYAALPQGRNREPAKLSAHPMFNAAFESQRVVSPDQGLGPQRIVCCGLGARLPSAAPPSRIRAPAGFRPRACAQAAAVRRSVSWMIARIVSPLCTSALWAPASSRLNKPNKHEYDALTTYIGKYYTKLKTMDHDLHPISSDATASARLAQFFFQEATHLQNSRRAAAGLGSQGDCVPGKGGQRGARRQAGFACTSEQHLSQHLASLGGRDRVTRGPRRAAAEPSP